MDTSKISNPDMGRAGKKRQAAFSLVEVTLAIGVVAFAFIGVFGLIPTGLNTFRQAIDTSVGSQIEQRVINDLQQSDFTALVTSGTATNTQPFTYSWTLASGRTSPVRYFDDQGNEIVPVSPPSLAPSEQQKILYWVNTRVTPATTVTNSGTYSNLATVTIQVAKNPGNRTLAPDSTLLWPSTNLPVSTYSALVARNTNQ